MNASQHPIGCYPLPSGSIRAVVTINGRQISPTFPTEAEAIAWRRAALAAKEDGRSLPRPCGLGFRDLGRYTPFNEVAEAWFAHYARNEHTRHNPLTEKVHQQNLAIHHVPFFGTTAIGDIRIEEVEAFRDALAGRGLAISTQQRQLWQLRVIIEYARNRGWLDANPAALVSAAAPSNPRRRHGTTPYIPAETVYAASTLMHCGYRVGLWIQALCGLRKSELFGLHIADWDPTARTLRVVRQGGHRFGAWEADGVRWSNEVERTKTLSSKRVVGVPMSLALLIDQYIADVHGNSGPHVRLMRTREGGSGSEMYAAAVRTALSSLGVTDSVGMPVTTHALRKSYVSTLDALKTRHHLMSYLAGHRGGAMEGAASITETVYNVRNPLVSEIVVVADAIQVLLNDSGITSLDVKEVDAPTGEWLSLPEAAVQMGLGERTILNYARLGKVRLTTHRAPGERSQSAYVCAADVEHLIEERAQRVTLSAAARTLGVSSQVILSQADRLGIPVRRERDGLDQNWFDLVDVETLFEAVHASARFHRENVSRTAASKILRVSPAIITKLVSRGLLTPIAPPEHIPAVSKDRSTWVALREVEALGSDPSWRVGERRVEDRPGNGLLPPAEAAALTGLSTQTILRLRRSGILKGKCERGRVWIDRESAESYREANRRELHARNFGDEAVGA